MPDQIFFFYAVSGRYPGFDDPVTEDDWQQAVCIAKTNPRLGHLYHYQHLKCRNV